MIMALLAQAAVAAAGIDGTPLGALPGQELPATGCAAFLWTTGATHQLVAMAGADPARLRLVIDGAGVDLPRAAQEGAGGFGFAASTRYQQGETVATLDLTIESRASLTGGAAVPGATLRLDRPGHDGVIMPVGGLIGCAPATDSRQNH